jgi:hypothetical protein
MALGDTLSTDTTVYAGTLGAESTTSTYGATTLGAALSTAAYPPAAAPTFVQAGTGVPVTGASATVDIPTAGTVAGAIIILHAGKIGTGAAPTLTSVTNIENLAGTDAAMTLLNASEEAAGAGEHNIWIGRILVTNTATSLVYNGPAADSICRLYQFTGVHTGTTLNDVVENDAADYAAASGTASPVDDVGVVTNGTDRLACQFVFLLNDVAIGPFTGETGGDWAEAVTEYQETGTTPDGTLQLQTATIASAGTINGGSVAIGATDDWGVIGLALIP